MSPGLRYHLPDSTQKFYPKLHSPHLSPLSVTAEAHFSHLAWLPQTHRLFFPASPFAGIRAYEQLGQRAFGPAGKVVVAVIICLHNVGGEDLGRVNYGEEGGMRWAFLWVV